MPDEDFPQDIKSIYELTQLLKNIASRHPFLQLSVSWENGFWVLHGKKAHTIAEINIHLVTRKLFDYLEPIKQNFTNLPDSPEVREKILSNIREILFEQGFPNPTWQFSVKEINNKVSYNINIDEGKPCLVRKVAYDFRMPKTIVFELKPGDVCNVESINEAFDDLEDQLKEDGYKNAELRLGDLEYSEKKEFVDVQIFGVLGKKSKFKFVDLMKKFSFNDILYHEKMNELDLNNFNPETLKAEIAKIYQVQGFEDVTINGPIQRNLDPETIEYTFEISSGPQYFVQDLQFEGNHVFSTVELQEKMEVVNFFNTPVVLNRENLNERLDLIQDMYREEGYWDVKMHQPRITKDPNTGSAKIVILLNEGKQRILDEIEFKGNHFFSAKELLEIVDLEKEDSLDKNKLVALEEKIRTAYVKKGFVYADVKLLVTSQRGLNQILTNLLMQITENARVKIGKITILGLIRTDPSVIQRELLFKTGDWYNPDKINSSREAISGLGFFRSVQISFADKVAQITNQKPVLDLIVEAYEGMGGNVGFGPGFNLEKGFYYVGEIGYNNLFGLGKQVSLKASVSQEKDQVAISESTDPNGKTFLGRTFGVSYVEPHIFDLPVNGKVSLSHKGIADSIWQITNTLELSLTHKDKTYFPVSTITPFYSLRQTRDEGTQEQVDTLVATGNARIGSLGVRYSWDHRDNISWPTKGYLFSSEFSWARYTFGGDFHYFKWDVGHNFYFSIFDLFVSAFSVQVTSFESIERRDSRGDESVLPSSERLLASGGYNRVRGFKQQLGPYVLTGTGREQPFGGTRRVILKSEMRKQLVDNKLGLSLFMDSGNTFFSSEEIKKFSQKFESTNYNGGIRPSIEDNVGYGFGELFTHPGYLYSRHFLSYGSALNFLTPLGAVSLAFAWPLHEPKTERCIKDGICYPRANQASNWFKRCQVDLNIGSEF